MSFRYERAVELVERAAESGRLAHAYLLMGPPGSGKERLAIRMIEMAGPSDRLVPAASLEELRSPTVAVVSPESKSRRISVEAIREVEHLLQMGAPGGVTKFAVIREADRMGDGAGNAFLKTLEEPPSSCRILLLTSRPEMLLETILSRCIRVPLAGPLVPEAPGEGVAAFLALLGEQAIKGRSGLPTALLLAGAFASLLKSEKEAIEKSNAAAAKEEAARYKNKTDGNYLKDRETYWEALTASEYLDRRSRILEYLVSWFGDALRQKQGVGHRDLPWHTDATSALARQFPPEDLIRRLGGVEELRDHLATNVNESLALEVAFLRAFG
jgi:DNA polymerase-3 subunit delta'